MKAKTKLDLQDHIFGHNGSGFLLLAMVRRCVILLLHGAMNSSIPSVNYSLSFINTFYRLALDLYIAFWPLYI